MVEGYLNYINEGGDEQVMYCSSIHFPAAQENYSANEKDISDMIYLTDFAVIWNERVQGAD